MDVTLNINRIKFTDKHSFNQLGELVINNAKYIKRNYAEKEMRKHYQEETNPPL